MNVDVTGATTGLHWLSVAQAARAIAHRELSPVELTQALLDRIQRLDPKLNAFIRVDGDAALQAALTAETEIAAGRARGPLHGVPVGIKDIIDVAGLPTTGHSKVLADSPAATADAVCVSKLRQAGAIVLGKLSTHEFAIGGPSHDLPWPPARNPWHLAHFTGGSSSGSGAAVAAGLVPMALGSDTGGSIRGPASLCGVVGLMPTFGLVSRAGVIPNSYTFDHCGPLARSVEDCALVMQAIAGFDPRDAGSIKRDIPDYRAALRQDLQGLRIGVLRHNLEEDLPAAEDVRTAMEEALHVLKSLGAELEDCHVHSLQHYFDIKVIIAETEIFSIHQPDLIARPHQPRVLVAHQRPVCVVVEHEQLLAPPDDHGEAGGQADTAGGAQAGRPVRRIAERRARPRVRAHPARHLAVTREAKLRLARAFAAAHADNVTPGRANAG